MGKKPRPQPKRPPEPNSLKATPSVITMTPTQEQLNEIALLEMRVTEETGVAPVPAEPRPDLALDQALRRVSGILDEVEKLRTKIKDAEQDAVRRISDLESQKRDQETNYRRLLKEVDDSRKQVAADAQALSESRQRAEQDWLRRSGELDARERGLLDREAAMAQREANAEAGFLNERRAVLAGLEDCLARLREERSQLITELTNRRTEAEAEQRRIDEARAAAQRAEDAARANDAQQARQALTDELARERTARLAAIEAEVERIRRDAEERQRREEEARRTALDEERRALDAERVRLRTEALNLQRERNAIEADRELLEEDCRAFDDRVERFASVRLRELEEEVRDLTDRLRIATAARDQYHTRLLAHEEIQRRLGERTPEDLLAHLADLEQRNVELREELNNRLSNAAERRLAELERERADWSEEQVVLRRRLADSERQIGLLRVAATELDTVKRQKEALETNKKLLEAALQELQAEVDKYTRADDKRNPMEALLAIDRNESLQVDVRTWKPLSGPIQTLKDFAVDLRHRIADGVEGRRLYYSERDVRCFLGGIAMSRLLLLQGISGTGKTSLPLAFAGAIGSHPIGCEGRRNSEAVEVIEVQAGWRDRQDLVGYFNAFHRHYYATNFLQALYRAGTPAFRDRPFLIILDEINLSRVEQFFADFLSALEQPESSRRLTLLNDPVPEAPRLLVEGRHLPIPPNVWFVGTANHDETTTEFADKTYDRAHIMELPRRDPKQAFEVKKLHPRDPISYEELMAVFEQAVADRKDEVTHVHGWLRSDDGIAGILERNFRIGWGNRLEEQVRRFVPVVVEAGGSVGEAVDHLLQTRVLRKLRDRHDVRHRALEEFRNAFEKAWNRLDKDNPPERCLALLDRELRAKKDEL